MSVDAKVLPWLLIAASLLARQTGQTAIDDQKQIQGQWEAVKITAKGDGVNVEDASLILTFDGKVFCMKLGNGVIVLTGQFDLNAKAVPKEIDVLEQDRTGRTRKAMLIYRFDGDRLITARVFSDEQIFKQRPTSFKETADMPLVIGEWVRQKSPTGK